nr:MAG TPA: hypothetical protein [Caudoviricetes sp.]
MFKNKWTRLFYWNIYLWFWTSTNRRQYRLFKWPLSVHLYSVGRFLRYNLNRLLHGL